MRATVLLLAACVDGARDAVPGDGVEAGVDLVGAVHVGEREVVGSGSERADLYFEDGSMLSLTNGSPGAERLLPLAREVIRTARTA